MQNIESINVVCMFAKSLRSLKQDAYEIDFYHVEE